MFIESNLGPSASVKSFNACVPIGTDVVYQGRMYKTWSWAGIGQKHVPVVFLDNGNDQPPVPIESLQIEGVEMVSQRLQSGESTGKGHGRKHANFSLFGDE